VKVAKKDWIFIALIAVLLGALFMSTTGGSKARNVPYDDRHRRFYDLMHTGGDRTETEGKCMACHGPSTIPLSRLHPPKEQCLLCHKLSRR